MSIDPQIVRRGLALAKRKQMAPPGPSDYESLRRKYFGAPDIVPDRGNHPPEATIRARAQDYRSYEDTLRSLIGVPASAPRAVIEDQERPSVGGSTNIYTKRVSMSPETWDQEDSKALLAHEYGHVADFNRWPPAKTLRSLRGLKQHYSGEDVDALRQRLKKYGEATGIVTGDVGEYVAGNLSHALREASKASPLSPALEDSVIAAWRHKRANQPDLPFAISQIATLPDSPYAHLSYAAQQAGIVGPPQSRIRAKTPIVARAEKRPPLRSIGRLP